MNFNALLVLLLLTVSTGNTFSQDGDLPISDEIRLTKSDPYKVIDARVKRYYTDNEGGILAVKYSIGKRESIFNFQKFSGDNLNEESRKTETIAISGFKYKTILEFKGKLYLFYTIFDKKNRTEELFARQINLESGGFEDSPELILQLNTELYNGFSFEFSEDESIMLIKSRKTREFRDDSKNTDVFKVEAFDYEFNSLWKEEFKMPYTEALMDNLDFTIASNGNAYFLIRKYKEESSRLNNDDPNNQSFALLISQNGDDLEEVEFSLEGDNMILSGYLMENANNDIICAGYYKKPKSYSPDGTFVSIYSPNHGISSPQLYEFSLDFIKKYNPRGVVSKKKMEKKENKGELGLDNLRLRNIRTLADGGILIVGEIYYVTTRTDSKGNTRTTYHYNDVILTKINADGDLDWMKKLPKKSTFESYKLLVSDNYAYVLFSDNPKNLNLKDDQRPYLCRGSERQVITYRMNLDSGEKNHLALFGYRKIDDIPVYQYSLRRVVGLHENSFAVEMYIKQKSDMMFKIEFEED